MARRPRCGATSTRRVTGSPSLRETRSRHAPGRSAISPLKAPSSSAVSRTRIRLGRRRRLDRHRLARRIRDDEGRGRRLDEGRRHGELRTRWRGAGNRHRAADGPAGRRSIEAQRGRRRGRAGGGVRDDEDRALLHLRVPAGRRIAGDELDDVGAGQEPDDDLELAIGIGDDGRVLGQVADLDARVRLGDPADRDLQVGVPVDVAGRIGDAQLRRAREVHEFEAEIGDEAADHDREDRGGDRSWRDDERA